MKARYPNRTRGQWNDALFVYINTFICIRHTPPPPARRVKNQDPSGISISVCDVHAAVFPYFARWCQAFGKVFVYWLGTNLNHMVGVMQRDTAGMLRAGPTPWPPARASLTSRPASSGGRC